MNEKQTKTQIVFKHKPTVWRKYKKGQISYREYLAAGRYEIPANLSLRELMAYQIDTPRASDY